MPQERAVSQFSRLEVQDRGVAGLVSSEPLLGLQTAIFLPVSSLCAYQCPDFLAL